MKFKPVCLRYNLLDFEKVEFPDRDDSDDSDSKEDHCVFKSNEQVDCNGMTWCLYYECRVADGNQTVIYVLPQFSILSIEEMIQKTENQTLQSNAFIKCTFTIKNSNRSTLNEIDAEFNANFLRWRVHDHSVTSLGTHLDTHFPGMKQSAIMIADSRTIKAGYINMTIQIKDSGEFLCRPKKEHSDKMMSLLKSGEKSDASFTVGGKAFRVHSQILHAHTPILASYCDDTIADMSAETFQILLEYIYAGHAYQQKKIF